jgi:hypothetical protein
MVKGIVVAVVIVSSMLCLPSYANANFLADPGFESGSFNNGWGVWNESNATINNWGRSGNYSAAGWSATAGYQDVVISDPSAALKVGGYIYDDVSGNESLRDGAYASLRVEFKRSDDSIVGTWTTGNLTGSDLADNAWNEKIGIVTPLSYGSDIAKATFVWEVNNSGSGNGRGIFDDLTIESAPVPEPASLLLLGSGLFGLGFLNSLKNKRKG